MSSCWIIFPNRLNIIEFFPNFNQPPTHPHTRSIRNGKEHHKLWMYFAFDCHKPIRVYRLYHHRLLISTSVSICWAKCSILITDFPFSIFYFLFSLFPFTVSVEFFDKDSSKMHRSCFDWDKYNTSSYAPHMDWKQLNFYFTCFKRSHFSTFPTYPWSTRELNIQKFFIKMKVI